MTFAPVAYTASADEYHADPAERPSLSSSIAKILCNSSPLHAWTAHPRLNPNFKRQEKEQFDIGSIAHQLLLEGGASVRVIEADDWRTNAAKEQRDEARAAGLTPILARHWESAEQMMIAARKQLDQLDVDPPLFADGKPEQTLMWDDKGVMCRARLDWLRDDFMVIDDYKSTSHSANPESWSRTMFNMGFDIQAAFYLRGVAKLTGEWRPGFRFVVQETYPPYALAVFSPAPAALSLASRKVQYAIDLWRTCLEANRWPAYPTQVCWAEPPGWLEAQWLEREALAEETAA